MAFIGNIFFTLSLIHYLSVNPVNLNKGIFHQALNLQATPEQSQTKRLIACNWFSKIKDTMEPNFEGLSLTRALIKNYSIRSSNLIFKHECPKMVNCPFPGIFIYFLKKIIIREGYNDLSI
jgi:hypothetical protein